MILFVDDEKRRMNSYILELELSAYIVKFEKNIDCAIEFFENNREDINLVILDMMMPTGTTFNNKQTGNGMRTGLCFYKLIRQYKPNLPIIIFTNVSGNDLSNDVNNNSLVFQKDVLFPFELVRQVKKILVQ
jgi:CheY-like chemotaxis protein